MNYIILDAQDEANYKIIDREELQSEAIWYLENPHDDDTLGMYDASEKDILTAMETCDYPVIKPGDYLTVTTKHGDRHTGKFAGVTPNCIRIDSLFFNYKVINGLQDA